MMIEFVFKFLDIFSTLMFWVLFGLCFSWFVFFKFQSLLYCMMPADYKTYQAEYDRLMSVTLCFKFVAILVEIYFKQTNNEIFFIDWEPLRGYKNPTTSLSKRAVSPWRRLFLANEFSEL